MFIALLTCMKSCANLGNQESIHSRFLPTFSILHFFYGGGVDTVCLSLPAEILNTDENRIPK